MSQKHDDFGFSFLTVKPNIIEDQEKTHQRPKKQS